MTRAIAPTLPDEACDRQTQFGGASKTGALSGPMRDYVLFGMCFMSRHYDAPLKSITFKGLGLNDVFLSEPPKGEPEA
ncbi:hypothetical protein [Oceanicaulis sp. MMSF_3324]|uniref:hypothetical protein n=1 Tax=Oceanicaulis sp. MMSF_3324 TaxID=3046702 RepID=UPI00273E28EA|nr:hypothetical protein [Oceanicaulis sp. MMSF_3324]